MIPALHDAEFVRYGVMHRNTFLDSPRLLDRYYADRRNPLVAFAGQMTGVEGLWNPLRPAIWQLSAWLQNWVEHRFRISRRKLPSARCLSTSAIPASAISSR